MKGENKHKMCSTIVKNYKQKGRGGGKNYHYLFFLI